jgi:rfaE bifunctional protein nucleotidyltransferase chain/domain
MIFSISAVSSFCDDLQKKNRKIVFTNGCFDILHIGHVRYLTEAKALGDYLFVGVNSDSSVSQLKGPDRPVQPEKDRAEILSQLKSVDGVCIFSESTPLELIRLVRPSVLVKGGDWKPEQIVGKGEVESWGGRVLSLPFVPNHSTSEIFKKIQKL